MGNVVQFRRRVPKRRMRRRWSSRAVLAIAAVMLALLGGAFVVANNRSPVSGATVARDFTLCETGVRINCVVDGDTFWMDGTKIRIQDINAPEIGEPKCNVERALGYRATQRLLTLLNDGAFQMWAGLRDEDKYGRKLRTVSRNGKSLGSILIDEGLAHRWEGAKRSWC